MTTGATVSRGGERPIAPALANPQRPHARSPSVARPAAAGWRVLSACLLSITFNALPDTRDRSEGHPDHSTSDNGADSSLNLSAHAIRKSKGRFRRHPGGRPDVSPASGHASRQVCISAQPQELRLIDGGCSQNVKRCHPAQCCQSRQAKRTRPSVNHES